MWHGEITAELLEAVKASRIAFNAASVDVAYISGYTESRRLT
jgi:hypothetical protein